MKLAEALLQDRPIKRKDFAKWCKPKKIKTEYGFLSRSLPVYQEFAPYFLKFINQDFIELTAEASNGLEVGQSLTGLNDSLGFDFNEISDILQAVYIERIFE